MDEDLKRKMREGRERAAEKRALAKALEQQEAFIDVARSMNRAVDAAMAEEDAPPSVAEPEEDRRARLLEGIDPAIAALISDAELDQIEAEERERAEAERKKKALGLVRDTLRQRARVENELIDSATLLTDSERKRRAEPVTFRVNVPAEGSGHKDHAGFRVDGFLYQNRREYTRPRAVFESLQSNHYRTWLSEVEFKTLDQHKPGNSAREVLARQLPSFEVLH